MNFLLLTIIIIINLTLTNQIIKIMSVAEFVIVSDETIELLDDTKEHILLRMMLIKNKCNDKKECIVFDSKKRFYIIHGQKPQIKNLYYSSSSVLLHHNSWKAYVVHILRCDVIPTMSTMYRYFYENRDEYCPSFGLSNFELK